MKKKKIPFKTLADEANAIDALLAKIHAGKRFIRTAAFCSDAYKAAANLRVRHFVNNHND